MTRMDSSIGPLSTRDPRILLKDIFAHAVMAVRGDRLVGIHGAFDGACWRYQTPDSHFAWNIPPHGRVLVIGAGKAAASLALGLERVLGSRIDDGCIIVKYGHTEPLRRIHQIEAGHPVPDAQGLAGVERIRAMLKGLTPDDRVFVLLTGGASSLMVSPIEGVTLEEKAQVTELLLRSGASIDEINGVRKLLSQVKGGKLLDSIAPAQSLTLLVSDVPNGDYGTIGSGPTIPDQLPDVDAIAIFDRHGITDQLPAGVRAALSRPLEATPDRTSNAAATHALLIAESATMVRAVDQMAHRLGLDVEHVDLEMHGSTHAAAHRFAQAMREAAQRPGRDKPLLLVAAGETTLQVTGKGKGGRNQEFALVAAKDLAGLSGVALLAAGTDGTDGPTDAAGAFADGDTAARAVAAGVDLDAMLADNDAYHFFAALDDLHITGASGTNVMDLVLGIIC